MTQENDRPRCRQTPSQYDGAVEITAFGSTDVGQERTTNEDAFGIDEDLGAYVVCDGMGGHAAGELASSLATQAVQQYLLDARNRDGVRPTLVALGRGALEHACAVVYKAATSDPKNAGMGCTLTLLLIDGSRAAMAHVGDSRLYLLRADNVFQLSADHTFAAELVRAGQLDKSVERSHRYANVLTRAIGVQEAVQVDVLGFELFGGDRFLMCSDGLSNYIEDDTWVGQVLGEDGLEDVATTCIRHANESGGRDNITVIAIEVEEDDSTVEVVVQPLTLDQAVDQLSDSFLFRGLTFAQRLKLRSACRLQRLEEGEALVAAGETVDRLIYVVDGRLQLIRSSEPVCDLAPGQHIGGAVLLAPRAARSTVTASEATIVLMIRADRLRKTCSRLPWLAMQVWERLAEELAIQANGTNGGGPTSADDLL